MNGLLNGAPNEFSMEYMAKLSVSCGDALIDELDKESEDDGIAAVAKRVRRKREPK